MEHSGTSEVTGADTAGPDPQLAVTMGFTGFGKKARTFDLEAMFEQTRRTAVERSRKTLAEPVLEGWARGGCHHCLLTQTV